MRIQNDEEQFYATKPRRVSLSEDTSKTLLVGGVFLFLAAYFAGEWAMLLLSISVTGSSVALLLLWKRAPLVGCGIVIASGILSSVASTHNILDRREEEEATRLQYKAEHEAKEKAKADLVEEIRKAHEAIDNAVASGDNEAIVATCKASPDLLKLPEKFKSSCGEAAFKIAGEAPKITPDRKLELFALASYLGVNVSSAAGVRKKLSRQQRMPRVKSKIEASEKHTRNMRPVDAYESITEAASEADLMEAEGVLVPKSLRIKFDKQLARATKDYYNRCIPHEDKTESYSAAKDIVRNNLKSPSTADFPWGGWSVNYDQKSGKYVVSSYVDAQNSFGAVVRTSWEVKVCWVAAGGIRYDVKM